MAKIPIKVYEEIKVPFLIPIVIPKESYIKWSVGVPYIVTVVNI